MTTLAPFSLCIFLAGVDEFFCFELTGVFCTTGEFANVADGAAG